MSVNDRRRVIQPGTCRITVSIATSRRGIDLSDARVLGAQWHRMLAEAQAIVEILPPEQTGTAVLDRAGNLYRQPPDALSADLHDRAVFFHTGRIRGVWPAIASE